MYSNARCIPASINEMPAPDAVFVFIEISYKILYNRFWVIRVFIKSILKSLVILAM